jgi:hypothetical protein
VYSNCGHFALVNIVTELLLCQCYQLVTLMHTFMRGALTPSTCWKLILEKGEAVLHEILSRSAHPSSHWRAHNMTRGFLQYLHARMVDIISWHLLFRSKTRPWMRLWRNRSLFLCYLLQMSLMFVWKVKYFLCTHESVWEIEIINALILFCY